MRLRDVRDKSEAGERPHSGEIGLWCAVMLMAINDSWRNGPGSDGARRWLNSPLVEVGSFIWICEITGLEPEAVLERTAA